MSPDGPVWQGGEGCRRVHEPALIHHRTAVILCHWMLRAGSNSPMDPRPPGEHREFNTPIEMLERLVFLLGLGGFTAGVLLVLGGLLSTHPMMLLSGLAALVGAWFGREWLQARGRYEVVTDAFEAWPTNVPCPPTAETFVHVAQLTDLLRRWDELEQLRGSPDFDVWAVQGVRNEIHSLVDADPALADLFRPHRRKS